MIFVLISILMSIVFVAVVAVSIAFLMHRHAPGFGVGLRSVIAALLTGVLIATLPLVFVMGLDGLIDLSSSIVPMLLAGSVCALAVGFPAAFLMSRRWAEKNAKSVDPDTFR